ncbi:heavy metal translocating P-type ATPase metal-binding domain-containing protein [Eikenella halliae]|uniref:heavy metal translocating P-type ATPase metal-binding domain-containing protein n=1 Tax=Eikenella halliae TaxID=1795832 RepID=UPI00370D207B
MSHTESPSETQTRAETCFHCGLPVPRGLDLPIEFEGTRHPACCAGCQGVGWVDKPNIAHFLFVGLRLRLTQPTHCFLGACRVCAAGAHAVPSCPCYSSRVRAYRTHHTRLF